MSRSAMPPNPTAGPPPVTVVLIRHARSSANSAGILAGRTPGVALDEVGTDQAARLVERLAAVPIGRILRSPLLRCEQTVAPLAEARNLVVEVDDDLNEVDYGSWSGRSLRELADEPHWRVVQQQPAAAEFPGGEALAAVAARAARAVRRAAASSRGDAALVVCTHGDVIKAVLADALGMHLDHFQRINVAPASISVVRYLDSRPYVDLLGDTGDLAAIARATTSADAVIGGDTGSAAAPSSSPPSAEPSSATPPSARSAG